MMYFVLISAAFATAASPTTAPKVRRTGAETTTLPTTRKVTTTFAPTTFSTTTTPETHPPTTISTTPKTKEATTFLHLTDLHLSRSRQFSKNNLSNFCQNILPLISDSVAFIVITGDFTDGISDFLGFGRFQQEESDWQIYTEAIQKCVQALPVFTIRGNHDCFDVHSFNDETNRYFLKTKQNLPLNIVHHVPSGSYAFEMYGSRFIFLEEARIMPAPHQYHGEFSHEEAEWLKSFVEGPSNTRARMTYVFGHYPLGSLIPDSRARLLDALQNSISRITYLSGHIHSVVGRNGVQAIRSHKFVDELQLSDFKWSGIVRKIEVATAAFVDIPTIGWSGVAGSLFFDPNVRYGENRHSQLSLYSVDKKIIYASQCNERLDGRIYPMDHVSGNIAVFSLPPNIPAPVCVVINFEDNTQKELYPVDTRLWDKSFGKYVFSYFFEFLQVSLLVVYILLVLVARHLFVRHHLLVVPIYLVLSPLIPTTVGAWIFGRNWVAANGVAMLDLQTWELFFDSETTRVGFTLVLYLFTGIALSIRLAPIKRVWVYRLSLMVSFLVLVPATLLDLRLCLARGGVRSLILSPHTWFLLLVWYQQVMHRRTDKRD